MTTDHHDAKQIATSFLAAMEARELQLARSYLADNFVMVFPDTNEMSTIQELIRWAGKRYRFVRKKIQCIEAFQQDDLKVVYIQGTLSGEWPDKTTFEGIRFIDRFEIRDSKIARQDVWNDIAEVRAK